METPRRAACDRCRAQKLRCNYSDATATSCDRCRRAQVSCNHSPSLRMGRRPRKRRHPLRSDKPNEGDRTDSVIEVSTSSNTSISGNKEISTFTPFQWFANTDIGMFDFLNGCDENAGVFHPSTGSASGRDISMPEDVSPTSDAFTSDPSLESGTNTDFAQDTEISLTDFQDSRGIVQHRSLTTGGWKNDSRHVVNGTEPPETCEGGANHSNARHQLSSSQCNPESSGPGSSMRQLSELNLELQDLVSRSQESATGKWTYTQQSDSRSAGTPLIIDILDCSQRYLEILNRFQPKLAQSCVACQRLDPYSPHPRDRSNGCKETFSATPRLDTQTLSLVIGCFMHVLRVLSNLFSFLRVILKMHTSPTCSQFPQMLSELKTERSCFDISQHLQAIMLVQIARYLLDSIETALGCRHLLDVPVKSKRSEGSLITPEEQCAQNRSKDCTCDSHVTPKESRASLLSRYSSLDLLETMMRHEDVESKERGRRSLRDLRADMNKVQEALQVM